MAGPFVFTSSADLKPTLTKWLVKGLVPDDAQGELIGPPAAGKSFLAIDLAFCVATGTPFHGHAIKRTGPVFYIAGEGHNGLSRRFEAWQRHHRIRSGQVFLSERACSLLDPESVASVLLSIREIAEVLGTPALIILDTLARNFGNGDENSTRDMGHAVMALDEIRGEFGCTMLSLHHTGHEGTRGRGSSALKGASDFQFKFEEDRGVRVLSSLKVKEDRAPERMAFKLVDIRLGIVDDDGFEERKAVLELTEAPQPPGPGMSETTAKVLKWFQDNPEIEAGPKEVSAAVGVMPDNAGKSLEKLVEARHLEKLKRGTYSLLRNERKTPENPDLPEAGIQGTDSENRNAPLGASGFPNGVPSEEVDYFPPGTDKKSAPWGYFG